MIRLPSAEMPTRERPEVVPGKDHDHSGVVEPERQRLTTATRTEFWLFWTIWWTVACASDVSADSQNAFVPAMGTFVLQAGSAGSGENDEISSAWSCPNSTW